MNPEMEQIIQDEIETLQDAAQMPRIRFATTERFFPTETEDASAPSETIPDQSLSLIELLHRHTKGLPINAKEPIYMGDEPLPDLSKLDLTEIDELYHAARRNTDALREQLEQATLAERATYAEQERKKNAEKAAERLPQADNNNAETQGLG